MTTRTRNAILSTLRKMGDDMDEQIVLDCGHPYVMGKIRELLKQIDSVKDLPAKETDLFVRSQYEQIALYSIYGVHLCNQKQ